MYILVRFHYLCCELLEDVDVESIHWDSLVGEGICEVE